MLILPHCGHVHLTSSVTEHTLASPVKEKKSLIKRCPGIDTCGIVESRNPHLPCIAYTRIKQIKTR